MKWISYGLIFKPTKVNWIKSHAWVPTVYKYRENKAKFFLQEGIVLIIILEVLM